MATEITRRSVDVTEQREVAGHVERNVDAVTTRDPTTATGEAATISLTAAEYDALEFAAEVLRAHAERCDAAEMSALGDTVRRHAHALQHLHDRWHRAHIIARDGRPHRACGFCRDGAAPPS